MLMVSGFLFSVGGVFYALGSRKTVSLEVPLVSNRTKVVIGGTLIVIAIGILLFALLRGGH